MQEAFVSVQFSIAIDWAFIVVISDDIESKKVYITKAFACCTELERDMEILNKFIKNCRDNSSQNIIDNFDSK